MKVQQKQPKRRRLWLNDGSCVRLRPEHKDHVWSYDFIAARTSDGRPIRILIILDEYTRECLRIVVECHISSQDVINELWELFLIRDIPQYIRLDNGPEFMAKRLDHWAYLNGVGLDFSRPGKPTDNGLIEAFNGCLR